MLLQGDPNQNPLFQMAEPLKICISDPMLVKLKCVLKAQVYFDFSAICLQFFKKKLTASQIHFGFTNIGSEMHIFRGTAI